MTAPAAATDDATRAATHDALVAALRELNYAIEELSVSANFEMRSAAWGRIEVAQRAARAVLSSIGGGK